MKYNRILVKEIENQISLKSDINIVNGSPDVIFTLRSQSNKKDIIKFESMIKKSLDDIKKFYEDYSGLSMEWKIKHENMLTIEGKSFIRSLDSFMNGQQLKSSKKAKKGERHKEYLWEDGDDPELIKDLEDNYFILDIVEHYSKLFTIFKIEDDKVKLFLYKYPHHFYPLKLSFIEYIEKSIEYRGIYVWQDYFIDRENTTKAALEFLDSERPDMFHKNMKENFPEIEISDIPEPEKTINKYSFEILVEKKDYFRRFDKRFKQLEQKLNNINGAEYKLEYNIGKLNIPIIRRIEGMLNRALPDSMLAFYSQINGFRLSWKYPLKKDLTARASFNLLSLEQMFGGFDPMDRNWTDNMFEGIVTMKDVMDNESLTFAKQCRLMSNEEFNDTVVRFVEGKDEPEIYVMISGKFYPMKVSFEEYIELVLENMGVEYWQRFHIKKELYPDEEIENYSSTLEAIKSIFPDVDLKNI